MIGTINMLEAARAGGTRRFVFASTGGAIYGETDELPTPEDTEINSEAPYGHAKYSAEGYCDLWRRLHGLSTVSLRFGNVYGPRQDPLGEAGVVAIFCGKLRDGGQPTVFGDGLPDARLYICGGGRQRGADRGRERGQRPLQRRHRQRVLGARPRRGARQARPRDGHHRPDEPSSRSSRPARAGEVQRSALDPRKSREVLGFEARVDARGGPAPDARVGRGRGRRAVRRPRRLGCEGRSSLRATLAAGAGAPAVRLAMNASSGSICHGSLGPGRGAQPAARVALAHPDQLLDELLVEEEVAEQLAVRRALAAEQPVQEREVG